MEDIRKAYCSRCHKSLPVAEVRYVLGPNGNPILACQSCRGVQRKNLQSTTTRTVSSTFSQVQARPARTTRTTPITRSEYNKIKGYA